MRLLDYVEPKSFVQWAATALNHLQQKNVERILECAEDDDLQTMAAALADDCISQEQVIAVLVALDLYLQDFKGLGGDLIEFPTFANTGTISQSH